MINRFKTKEQMQTEKFRSLIDEMNYIKKQIHQNSVPSEMYLKTREERIRQIKWEMNKLVEDL